MNIHVLYKQKVSNKKCLKIDIENVQIKKMMKFIPVLPTKSHLHLSNIQTHTNSHILPLPVIRLLLESSVDHQSRLHSEYLSNLYLVYFFPPKEKKTIKSLCH